MVTGKFPECLGVVLAGGKSTRMGTDKANLIFRNGTLLDFQFEKLQKIVGRANVLVSGSYPKFTHVEDQHKGLGPLGGIRTVVELYREASLFLFLPVDMPNITEKSLAYLLEMVKADPQFDSWSFQDYAMPLIIRNHKSLNIDWENLMNLPERRRSVKNLCELLKHRSVETGSIVRGEFVNVNTKEVWDEAMA